MDGYSGMYCRDDMWMTRTIMYSLGILVDVILNSCVSENMAFKSIKIRIYHVSPQVLMLQIGYLSIIVIIEISHD
jgi:hypothetical protein